MPPAALAEGFFGDELGPGRRPEQSAIPGKKRISPRIY
jgi:hypothetical protein